MVGVQPIFNPSKAKRMEFKNAKQKDLKRQEEKNGKKVPLVRLNEKVALKLEQKPAKIPRRLESYIRIAVEQS